MNWSKNLYVFMLGALIVFSGCFGTGTTDGEGDDEVGTTVINNYYNNTTVMESMPEYTTITASGPHGNSVNGLTILILQQNAGEAIHLLDWSAVSEYTPSGGNVTSEMAVQKLTIDTTCWDDTSSEYEGGWSENLYQPGYNQGYAMDQWLAGTGLECSHHFSLTGANQYGATYDTDWMSAIYQIVPVVVA
ncbi:hypothetical protein OAV27_01225 [Euryarchaeota archaeon]|nr:hypothetical protein [Euryarchaeota archaeon]